MEKNERMMTVFENVLLALNLSALSLEVIYSVFDYRTYSGVIKVWQEITEFLKWDKITGYEVRFTIFILIPLYFLARTKIMRISNGQYRSVVSFTAHLIKNKNRHLKKDRIGLGLILANYVFLWIAFISRLLWMMRL